MIKKVKIIQSTSGNIVSSFFSNSTLLMILLMLLTCGIYYNSLNSPFIFDDIPKIVRNPDIKQISNIKTKLMYPYTKEHNFSRNDPSRPITYLSFTLNYSLGKLNPLGYHIFNILLHILNTILVFLLINKLTYNYNKTNYFLPFITALFFAVHPINTEVITYIYHRSEALALFFYLSAILFFIHSLRPSYYLYLLALISFILGLFSKQTTATLPLILLFIDYIFLSNNNIKEVIKNKYYHMPFWIILLSYIIFRIYYLGKLGDSETDAYLMWTNGSYFLTQPHVILRYIGLLIFPIGLCFDHLVKPMQLFELKTIISILMIIMLFVGCYLIYKKKSSISKVIIFGFLWFLLTISPTSSFIPIADAMAERRLYIPGLGLYLVFAFIYFQILGMKNINSYKFITPILIIHILFLMVVTITRNHQYKNPILLYQDVISKYPNNFRARNNLGIVYLENKEYDEAIYELTEAAKLNPNNSEIYMLIGNAYKELNQLDAAINYYNKSIVLKPSARVYHSLALIFERKNVLNKSIEFLKMANKIDPSYIEASLALSDIFQKLGDYASSTYALNMVIRYDPKNPIAYFDLGNIYLKNRMFDLAITAYENDLTINNNDAQAYSNIGLCYLRKGLVVEAVKNFKKAIDIAPNLKTNINYNLKVYSETSNKQIELFK